MQALTFPSNKSTELSFKMGIAGTNSAPTSVTVFLERNNTQIGYAAIKEGDSWKAIIENPGAVFGAGEVKCSVSVLLNSHLFVPFKSVAQIIEVVSAEIPQTSVGPSTSFTQDEVRVIAQQENVKPAVVPEIKKPEVTTEAKKPAALAKPSTPKIIAEEPAVVLGLLKSVEPKQTVKPKYVEAPVSIKENVTPVFSIRKINTVFR